MRKTAVTRAIACVLIAGLLTSCAASARRWAEENPQNCQINQNTTGASVAIGALGGAAVGGLAAGLSGQHGGNAAAIVLGAAAVGAIVGAVVAHERDEACHQLALQQALDLAIAQNDELQRQQAAARQAAEQEAARQAAEQETVSQGTQQPQNTSEPMAASGSPQSSTPENTPEYQTVSWADRMTNNYGAITPIANIADASNKQVCMTFQDTQTINGQSKTVLGKACRGSNGDWQPS